MTWRKQWLLAGLLTFLMATMAEMRGDVPESRALYTLKTVRRVELIILGISRLNPVDETRVLAHEGGASVNTNQEFIYISAAKDFIHFNTEALNTAMVLSADTPKLPVPAGTRSLSADGQELTVTVQQHAGHSSLVIDLDRRYNRTPRWLPSWWGGPPANPGGYPGYESEQPFCGRTLDAVLESLTGKISEYRPPFYVVTYQGLAEVVVPLKFQRISEGTVRPHQRLGPVDLVMFGVSPRAADLGDPDTATDAKIGAFGMRVGSTRELAYGYLLLSIQNGHNNDMYITLDTARPLPVESGVRTLKADGQEVEVGVWHRPDFSRLVIGLPRTYQRTPHWWPRVWGGEFDPGKYPDISMEKPFCGRTVNAVLQELLSGPAADYLPRWYTVSYVLGPPTIKNMDPWIDITVQGDSAGTFIVPSRNPEN